MSIPNTFTAGTLINAAQVNDNFSYLFGNPWGFTSNTGTVTSVGASGGTTGLTFAGSPITVAGTLTLGGTLAAANGGTGTGTAFTAGSVVFAGASGTYSQDNANLFWDDTNNRLGIGTTTPGRAIAVKGGGIAFDDANTVSRSLHWGDGTVYPVLVQGDAASGFLTFQTNTAGNAATERMRIDSAGNVGIGLTTPATKLDVAGTIWARADASSAIGMDIVGRPADNAGVLRFINNAANTILGSLTAYGNDVALINHSPYFSLTFSTAATERMRIDNAGNVGIGTSSPTALLELNSDTVRVRTAKTPASATAAGNAGDICWDSSYIYVCVATNTWKRAAIATW